VQKPLSIRFKLFAAFGLVCLIAAGAILYSVTQVGSLSAMLQELYDGPLMSISHARSAQDNFSKTMYAVEHAIRLHGQLSADELGAIETSMNHFVSDMNVVRERMGTSANANDLINSVVADSENWFKAALAYIKPSTTGATQLTSPLVMVDQGREIASLLERLVEAAAAYGFNFRFEAARSASSLFDILLKVAAVILVFGMAFATLSRDQSTMLNNVFEGVYRTLEIIIAHANLLIPVLAFGMAAFPLDGQSIDELVNVAALAARKNKTNLLDPQLTKQRA